MPPDPDPANDAPRELPLPLEYAPQPERRGWTYWARRFLARLSTPMPLAMYYAITFALSLVAFALAVILRLIVRALE